MPDTDHFARGVELLAEGRQAVALEQFVVAADEGPREQQLAAIAHAAHLNLRLGRPHEAMVWAERLAEEAPKRDQADLLAAEAQTRMGNGEAALALLDGVADPDTEHFAYPPATIAALRAEALAVAGRGADAVEAAVAALRENPAMPDLWRTLAQWVDEDTEAAVDVELIVGGLDDEGVNAAAAGLFDAPASGAERLASAMWERWPGHTRLVALLATIGHRLEVPVALEWSARLRAAGQGEHCPLLGLAASPDRHPVERVRAAAAAGRVFADDRARPVLEVAATALADEDISRALDEVLSVAPDLGDSVVVAAAQTGRRALLAAAALDASGNFDPALAVVRHALELTTGQPDAWRAGVTAAFSDPEDFARRAAAAGAGDVAAAIREA